MLLVECRGRILQHTFVHEYSHLEITACTTTPPKSLSKKENEDEKVTNQKPNKLCSNSQPALLETWTW